MIEEEKIYSKVKLRILPLLMVSFIFGYLDRTNISFAYMRMQGDLSFSDSVYGLGAGIFFIGYVLFEIPSNIWLHKIGARKWIARIMVTWGIISTATLFVSTPTHFYIMRFMLGVAEAGFFPGVILYLTYWFPTKYIRSVTSLFIVSIPVSSLVSSLLSGVILDYFSDDVLMKSWQWLFLIEGLPSIALGFIVYKYLPNGIDDAGWLSGEEKKLLIQAKNIENLENSSNYLLDVIKDGRVWIMAVMGGCFSIGMYGVIFWLPSIIKNSGVTGDFKIAMLSSIPWMFSILGMLLLSKIPANFGKKYYYVVIPGILSATGLILSVIFDTNIVSAIGFLSVATTGIMCIFPAFWSLTTFLTGASAAVGIALINSLSNVCGFFGPTIMGYINEITKTTSSSVYLMAGFILIGSLISCLFSLAGKK